MTDKPIRCFARLNAVSVRLAYAFHLNAMLDDWHFAEPTRSVLGAELAEVKAALIEGGLLLPGLEGAQHLDDLEIALHDGVFRDVDVLGFLVKAQQPHFRKSAEGLTYSWEQPEGKWFYAPTYKSALDYACTWGEMRQTAALASSAHPSNCA